MGWGRGEHTYPSEAPPDTMVCASWRNVTAVTPPGTVTDRARRRLVRRAVEGRDTVCGLSMTYCGRPGSERASHNMIWPSRPPEAKIPVRQAHPDTPCRLLLPHQHPWKPMTILTRVVGVSANGTNRLRVPTKRLHLTHISLNVLHSTRHVTRSCHDLLAVAGPTEIQDGVAVDAHTVGAMQLRVSTAKHRHIAVFITHTKCRVSASARPKRERERRRPRHHTSLAAAHHVADGVSTHVTVQPARDGASSWRNTNGTEHKPTATGQRDDTRTHREANQHMEQPGKTKHVRNAVVVKGRHCELTHARARPATQS